MCESAGYPAGGRLGEVEDAIGDLPDVHQLAGENEQRDGDEGEGIDPGDHLLCDDDDRKIVDQQRGQRAESDGYGDRDANQDQAEESDEQDQHDASSFGEFPCRERSSVASVWTISSTPAMTTGRYSQTRLTGMVGKICGCANGMTWMPAMTMTA